jgi:ribosomal protein S18 acetylase RimI-like enzyme
MSDLTRIEAFCRWLENTTSTASHPWTFGAVLRNGDFPNRWDSNFLRVERPLGEATARELIAEADRHLADARHREILVTDDDDGARVANGFAEADWEVDHLVYLALAREPDTAPTADVRELSFDDVRPFLVEVNTRSHGGTPEEAARMLADFGRVLVVRAGARFFGVRIDGRLAGACELYVHEGAAQIESVDTLEEFRGRGLARSFVTRAADEGRAAGADLVFLVADDADWPKHLYGKLGFDPVGGFWQFTKPPQGESYR